MLGDLWSDLRFRMRVLFRRNDTERELAEELRAHIEIETDRLVREGLPTVEARRQARLTFGGVEQVKEATRDARGLAWLDVLSHDLLHATRSIRRNPGFTALSVLSLGLGIGLSTSTFAYVEATWRPRLPYDDAAQLRQVQLRTFRRQKEPPLREQLAELRDLPSIQAVTVLGYEPRLQIRANGLSGYPYVARFAANTFEVIGLHPRLGRWPGADEMRSASAVVVSSQLWSRAFRNRAEIGDARVTIDNQTLPVVGVLPSGAWGLGNGADVWIPYPPAGAPDTANVASVVFKFVRLRRGVSLVTVAAELSAAAARLSARNVTTPGDKPYLLTANSYGFVPFRLQDSEKTAIGIAIGILLIAATNVAALALARAHSRRRDVALRVALGASRAAVAREQFTEVGVIAVLGAALGGAFSAALIGILSYMTPEELVGNAYGMHLPALSPNLFVYVLAGLVVSLAIAGGVPAWRTSQVDPADSLKDNAGTTTGRAKSEFRVLLITELAVAMVLVTLTSLLLISTRNLATFDFGFDYRSLVEARISLAPTAAKPDAVERARFYASMLARVRATPGVASVTTLMPSGFSRKIVSRPLYGAEHTLEPQGPFFDVGPDVFRTLGVSVIEGRDFSEGDRARGDAIILTEFAAHALFPRKNAIGSTVKIGGQESAYPWMRVIGVVHAVRFSSVLRGDPDVFMSSNEMAASGTLTFVVRPEGTDPQFMVVLERSLTAALPPSSSVYLHPMAESFEHQVRRTTFFTRTLTFIGLSALLLASVGLFSVLSFTVGRRMREFAVRVSLGASPRQILIVVMKDGLEVALAGAAIGALLSFWASAGISSALFGMRLTDPVGIIIAEVTLLVAAACASVVPAFRAAKADPMEVLRAI